MKAKRTNARKQAQQTRRARERVSQRITEVDDFFKTIRTIESKWKAVRSMVAVVR